MCVMYGEMEEISRNAMLTFEVKSEDDGKLGWQ